MNFKEWLEQTLSKADPRLYGEKEDAMQAAWEASKAEERERCLKIVEEYNGIKESPVHSTVSLIAEQIRKGE